MLLLKALCPPGERFWEDKLSAVGKEKQVVRWNGILVCVVVPIQLDSIRMKIFVGDLIFWTTVQPSACQKDLLMKYFALCFLLIALLMFQCATTPESTPPLRSHFPIPGQMVLSTPLSHPHNQHHWCSRHRWKSSCLASPREPWQHAQHTWRLHSKTMNNYQPCSTRPWDGPKGGVAARPYGIMHCFSKRGWSGAFLACSDFNLKGGKGAEPGGQGEGRGKYRRLIGSPNLCKPSQAGSQSLW